MENLIGVGNKPVSFSFLLSILFTIGFICGRIRGDDVCNRDDACGGMIVVSFFSAVGLMAALSALTLLTNEALCIWGVGYCTYSVFEAIDNGYEGSVVS